MDTLLRVFFEKFHQALGFDTSAKRDEQIRKLEDAVLFQALNGLVKHLAPPDKAAYDQMMRQQPDAKTIQNFFKPHSSDRRLEECFEAASRQVTGRYVKTMLELATGEQKAAVRDILAQFFKDLAVGREAQVKKLLTQALQEVG